MSIDTLGSSSPARRIISSPADGHWSASAAASILTAFPNESVYTCAAGISPSGVVHFGNFRDVMTSLAVAGALRQQGKKVRFVFSWDDFDCFRKVPEGVDPSFKKYIGMPLTAVPDPLGELSSYAHRYAGAFEQSLREMGIEPEFRYQTAEYASGRYDAEIFQALLARRRIADILLGFMSDKAKAEKNIVAEDYRNAFFPISLYSRFTGKDSTQVLGFDEDSGLLRYRCLETGKEDAVDVTKDRIVKLQWKIDWPMRWRAEGVNFEPGGKDHAAPGGSYDVSSVISSEIFGRAAPLFLGYEFVTIGSTKMSGSSGSGVSLAQLLEIYEPALLKWMYARRSPSDSFSLSFHSETQRQYEEFDRECQQARIGKLTPVRQSSVDLSTRDHALSEQPIPFAQAVAFGQLVQWDEEKVIETVQDSGLKYDPASVRSRLPKVRNWLEKHNPETVIKLNTEFNEVYAAAMSEESRANIRRLRQLLSDGTTYSVAELKTLVYEVPKLPELSDKENGARQRNFFADCYNLLLGNDTGPRIFVFLWAVNREQVLRLLDV